MWWLDLMCQAWGAWKQELHPRAWCVSLMQSACTCLFPQCGRDIRKWGLTAFVAALNVRLSTFKAGLLRRRGACECATASRGLKRNTAPALLQSLQPEELLPRLLTPVVSLPPLLPPSRLRSVALAAAAQHHTHQPGLTPLAGQGGSALYTLTRFPGGVAAPAHDT
jgi:hypothetical protein